MKLMIPILNRKGEEATGRQVEIKIEVKNVQQEVKKEIRMKAEALEIKDHPT